MHNKKRTRLFKSFLSALLTVSMGSFALSASAQSSEAQVFYESLKKVNDAMQKGYYAQALAQISTAEQASAQLMELVNLAPDPEEGRDIQQTLQAELVYSYTLLGQALYDAQRYTDALKIYDKSLAIAPHFPCTHYEKGYTHQALNQRNQAAVALYEAQRLARFAAWRKLPNPLNPNKALSCGREQIDGRSQNSLQELGFAPYYPLTVDLKTGQNIPGRIVPGMGAHLVRDRAIALYLEAPLAQALQALGPPIAERIMPYRTGEQLPHYMYKDVLVVADRAKQQVLGLYVYSPQASIATPAGLLSMGAPTRTVEQTLAAFEPVKDTLEDSGDLRESYDYPQLGFSVAMDHNDRIRVLSIYTME